MVAGLGGRTRLGGCTCWLDLLAGLAGWTCWLHLISPFNLLHLISILSEIALKLNRIHSHSPTGDSSAGIPGSGQSPEPGRRPAGSGDGRVPGLWPGPTGPPKHLVKNNLIIYPHEIVHCSKINRIHSHSPTGDSSAGVPGFAPGKAGSPGQRPAGSGDGRVLGRWPGPTGPPKHQVN